ncbi:hypothetical protein PI125_g26723 [Phytophthora idaei]|nr:hypothetical protein PI125_g26723 [Phytophthora idaei]
MSAATAAASATREGSTRPKPLLVSVKTFEGKDGDNLLLWTREIEMAMGSALLQTEQQRVALAISKLGGRAREWTLTCGTSVDAAFPSWAHLKQQLSRLFVPPNQAYRIRSRLLAIRQGKKELLDYVQGLRTLIAGAAAGPLPEAVTLAVFTEGLRTSAARTEAFCVHPTSFEEAMSVALNAEHNFRSARPDWHAGSDLQSIHGLWRSSHAMPRMRSYLESRSKTKQRSTLSKSKNFTPRSIETFDTVSSVPVARRTEMVYLVCASSASAYC